MSPSDSLVRLFKQNEKLIWMALKPSLRAVLLGLALGISVSTVFIGPAKLDVYAASWTGRSQIVLLQWAQALSFFGVGILLRYAWHLDWREKLHFWFLAILIHSTSFFWVFATRTDGRQWSVSQESLIKTLPTSIQDVFFQSLVVVFFSFLINTLITTTRDGISTKRFHKVPGDSISTPTAPLSLYQADQPSAPILVNRNADKQE